MVSRLGARRIVTEHMRKFVLAVFVIIGPALPAVGQTESSAAPATRKDTAKEQSGSTAALAQEQDAAKAQNENAHSGATRKDGIAGAATETGATEKDEAKTPVIVFGFM